MTLIEQFKAARRAGCPLITIHTADPAATMRNINASLNGSAGPIIQWDTVRGITAVNPKGKEIVTSIPGASGIIGAVNALIAAAEVQEGTILYMHQMHRVIGEPGVSQAVWNLRDIFKVTQRTLVMLCPSMEIPVELQQDVLVLDEPLPSLDQLQGVVKDIYRSAELPVPENVDKATDASCGLAAFPAEQACAMSIGNAGINLPNLWERKRRAVEETPGLSIHRGKETFESIGGCENVKAYFTALLNGREPYRAIGFIDEIEKQLAGVGSDSSGVSTEGHGILLTWMQEHRASGSIFLGPPGAAKSALAKAIGNMGGLLTITLDIGATKSSLVGESGARLRSALKVIESVSQGRALFIATCNSIDSLSPELRRRFKSGTFFFDLPTTDERSMIWGIYERKCGLNPQDRPADRDWTGAEIETCCETAWRLDIPLVQAANYIVPVAQSDAQRIKALRQQADGKFISASYPGAYAFEQTAQTGRKLAISE